MDEWMEKISRRRGVVTKAKFALCRNKFRLKHRQSGFALAFFHSPAAAASEQGRASRFIMRQMSQSLRLPLTSAPLKSCAKTLA